MSDKSSPSAEEKSPPRSATDIQAEIDETRERLVANLAQLKDETSPQALADRAKRAVTGVFVDPDTGELRRERVIAVASVVVGLILVRRGIKARHRKQHLKRMGELVWVPVPKQSISPELRPLARTAAELGPAPLQLTAAPE